METEKRRLKMDNFGDANLNLVEHSEFTCESPCKTEVFTMKQRNSDTEVEFSVESLKLSTSILLD